jgi:hypothetical protein
MKNSNFSRFFRETRFVIATSCFVMAFATIQSMNAQTTYTAIAGSTFSPKVDVNLLDAAAWPAGTTLPLAGDANIWSTGKYRLQISTTPFTFNGGTLDIANGGVLIIAQANPSLSLNNVTLNGGIIQIQTGKSAIVDLQNKTFTLNKGSLKTLSVGTVSRNLAFQNASLAGNGTITIAQIQTGAIENFVELKSTVNTVGFRGKFVVAPGLSGTAAGGMLKINAIAPANASFGVDVPAASGEIVSNGIPYKSSKNGKLYFSAVAPATVALTSLNLGGTDLAPATYGLIVGKGITVFTADQQVYIDSRSTGTITVVGTKK